METSRVTLNEDSQSQWVADKAEHLRYEYDLSPDDLVVDIGAHTGEFAQGVYDRYKCRVIAVEPTGYIERFSDGEIINQAASDYDGMQSFGGLSLYTSIFEPSAHRYPCFDINTLLAKHSEVALLKVNIEGGEYRLLRHILAGGMEMRIRNFQIQFHLIDGEPCERWYDQISEELAETHILEWQYKFCWESWKRA